MANWWLYWDFVDLVAATPGQYQWGELILESWNKYFHSLYGTLALAGFSYDDQAALVSLARREWAWLLSYGLILPEKSTTGIIPKS